MIVLGALKEDINDMLVQEFPDKFAGCVPRKFVILHTSVFIHGMYVDLWVFLTGL